MEVMKIKKESKRNKCFECLKRLSITAIKCKCNNIYCHEHRHAEKHLCTFDYKNYQKNILQKDLAKITNEKVLKI